MTENSILVGTLVDVSSSMKKVNLEQILDNERLALIPSIYSKLAGLIGIDDFNKYRVFTVGMGGYFGSGVFDIIGTIKNMICNKAFKDEIIGHITHSSENYDSIIEEMDGLLDSEGTNGTRKQINANRLKSILSYERVLLLLNKLKHDQEFKEMFVTFLQELYKSDEESENLLTADELKHILSKSLSSLLEDNIKDYSIEETSDVLQKFVTQSLKSSTGSLVMSFLLQGKHRILPEITKVLLRIVSPYIFGKPSLYSSLTKSLDIFSKEEFSNFKKYCVIISTGEDSNAVDETIIQKYRRHRITVVSCIIADRGTIQPRRLFNTEESQWDPATHLMFRISSDYPLNFLPHSIIKRCKWDMETNSKTFRMFLQINHPENLKDIIDVVHNTVCCSDSLLNVILLSQMSAYLNQEIEGFDPKNQKGAGCFVNAAATVVHTALIRNIENISGEVPKFEHIKDIIISRYGKGCTRTLSVLNIVCKQYNLHCLEITASDAVESVSAGRPVLASFNLTAPEWEIFLNYFKNSPGGVLCQDIINLSKRKMSKLYEHSVVFTSFHGNFIRLMNSWGSNWSDIGFFKVKNAATLNMKFYDIFTRKDKDDITRTSVYQLLYELQNKEYTCTLCQSKSFVIEYTGTLTSFVCPICKNSFEQPGGNILVQSNYIASLLH